MLLERFGNFIVKIVTFAAKSLTIFYLAKILDEDLFAKLGLIAAITIYYIYLAGMELHTLSNREFIIANEERKIYILNNLFVYYSVSAFIGYFVVYNVLSSLEISKFSNELIVISLIIITEHLALEVYRLLIASEKQLVASYTHLLRVSWIFAIIFLDITIAKVEFIQVIGFWLIFNIIGGLFGLVYVIKNTKISLNFARPDFNWLSKLLMKSFPFLVAALSLGGLSSIDRFLINTDYSIKTLAGYVFYFSIFNAIYSLIEAAIYVFAYPKLILQKENRIEFNIIYRRMWIESLCLFFILTCIGYLLLPYLLAAIGKLTYIEYSEIYIIFTFVMVSKVINTNLQYYLYALNMDKIVYISNILMSPFFLLFYFVTKEYFAFEGIMYSLIIAYVLNGLIKCYFIFNENNFTSKLT
jgi:hypothetical protein